MRMKLPWPALATQVARALTTLLAASAWVSAQAATLPASEPGAVAPSGATAAPQRAAHYPQQRLTDKARMYYVGAWGVDKMKASYTSSGNLIRFSYRVSDAELAKPLGSKDSQPVLVGLRSHVVLQVPVMDKVGPLRQATLPRAGQEYWMMFSNKGNLVRPGDRVNVIIGQFHADGLVVE